MGFRDFRDSAGTRWQAWDVIPRLVERRQGMRRARGPEGLRVVDERRNGMDRRIMATRRVSLGQGLERGWLCFESSAEKRRLAPIPGDWMRCRETQLEQYCEQAERVRPAAELRLARDFPAVALTAADAARLAEGVGEQPVV